MVGGVSPIREIRYDAGVVRVNRSKAVVVADGARRVRRDARSRTPARPRRCEHGRVPPAAEAIDPTGFAAGVLSWNLDLAPGESREVLLAIPFHEPYVEARSQRDHERARGARRW